MWPVSWWGQFNYQQGRDPYTNQPYPDEEPFASALQRDFPDWPLFVRAFGESQCYWSSFLGNYREVATTKWKSIKEPWEGSCSGFAISSLLAFDDDELFSNSFPEMPPFASLYPLAIGDSVRKVVNQLQVHHDGVELLAYRNQHYNKTPRQTLQDIKDMLLSETRDDRSIYIAGTNGAHVVIPYKVSRLSGVSGAYSVYVYDSNSPGNLTNQIVVDSTNNSWRYGGTEFGGTAGFFLRQPRSAWLAPPTLSNNPALSKEAVTSKAAQDYVQIYNTTEASILITDQGGNTLGFADSVSFDSFPDGIPIIPITSRYHPPIGYYVPAGEYSVVMAQFTDPVAYFSVFSDELVYSYRRSDAASNQSDELTCGNGFSVRNPDNQAKRFSLKAIVIEDTCERVFNIINPEVVKDDSMYFNVIDRRDLKIVKLGSGTTYDLTLRMASAVKNVLYEHSNITLESNSSHQIVPDWADLQNQPVKILVDAGNDGTIDDTLTVANQVTGIKDQGSLTVPQEYHLAQNYPNPFNPETALRFHLPQAEHVSIRIFNTLGQEVKILVDDQYPAGIHRAIWDATDKTGNRVSSGVYIYQIQAGTFA